MATFTGLTIGQLGTGYTLIATSAGLTSATTAGFNVAGVTATLLAVTSLPSPVTAGAPFTVQLSAQDAFGSTDSTYTGQVTLALGPNSPAGATLGGMLTVNAVKGVEIGYGFAAAGLAGEENADEMRKGPDGAPQFLSNHAGGILGGISTGQPIVARFAVKPTSSILKRMRTIDVAGNETEIATKGRHDPCVGIRAVPVGEAMMACVLADHALRHRAQMGG